MTWTVENGHFVLDENGILMADTASVVPGLVAGQRRHPGLCLDDAESMALRITKIEDLEEVALLIVRAMRCGQRVGGNLEEAGRLLNQAHLAARQALGLPEHDPKEK